MIKIKLIFFLFVKTINYNKVVAETNAAILKLITDYFKISSVKSYTDEDDIALNELRADSDFFNIINKIYVNSL